MSRVGRPRQDKARNLGIVTAKLVVCVCLCAWHCMAYAVHNGA